MKVLIIEDEIPAVKQLKKLLFAVEEQIQIIHVMDTVAEAVSWFKAPSEEPDLIFMDIQLADGLSFDIFEQVRVDFPLIFTTAFDNYMLKAFKVNSIDYLLKPIALEDLEQAIHKYQQFYTRPSVEVDYKEMLQAIREQQQQVIYKKRFLIKSGQELKFIPRAAIQYFYSAEGLVFAILESQKRYNIDYTLEQLEEQLPPMDFFRINRKLIIQLSGIQKIHTYFNGRLKLDLSPEAPFDVIVSRERVPSFKAWLDQ